MPPGAVGLLAGAGLIAGAVNSVAGGGTFFSFAALTAVGLPPLAANATSAVSMLPGQAASTLAYRRELGQMRRMLKPLALISAGGGLLGGWLLLHLPSATFRTLVPWLLLVATLLFALSPWLVRSSAAPGREVRAGWGAIAIQGMVAIYGGYFGAGMGIMMLASLALVFGRDYHAGNAAKNVLATLMQGFAVVLFALSGIVHWPEAAVVAVSGSVGGWSGVALARVVPPTAIRAVVVLTGLALTAWYAAH